VQNVQVVVFHQTQFANAFLHKVFTQILHAPAAVQCEGQEGSAV